MAGTWQVINGRRVYSGDNTAETVVGTADPETIGGRAGDDVLDGAGGDDAIDGGHGNDIIHGGTGNDALWDGSDLSGGAPGVIGRDQLFGDDGDDILRIWSPDTGDVADGGAGIDTLEVRFNRNVGPLPGDPPVNFVLVVGGSSVIQLNNINTVAVNNIEKLLFVGNTGADFITGGSFDDTLAGNGGNDVLRGEGGNDVLDAGTGIVDIDGGAGADRASFDLSGASEAFIIRNAANLSLGSFGSIRRVETLSSFTLGSGADEVRLTQASAASFETGAGNDTVVAFGQVSVETGLGNDVLTLGDLADNVDPGFGDDQVALGGGDDQLDYVATGTRNGVGNDTVRGQDGNDAIYTGSGTDRLEGGNGNDTLYAGSGNDQVEGGSGNDSINAEGGADIVFGGDGDDRIDTDYDYFSDSSPADNDAAFGEGGNDFLTGGLGADTLDGGAGNDTIAPGWRTYAGPGLTLDTLADSIAGGLGDDVLNISNLVSGGETHKLLVRLRSVTEVVLNGAVIGTARGFEALDVAAFGTGGHTIIGGALADRVRLSNGADSVSLGDGNDTIDMTRGSDTVDAGAGNDDASLTIDGIDRVAMGEGNDVLRLFGLFASDPAPVAGARFDGGLGTDTLILTGGSRGVSFDGSWISIEGVQVGRILGFERIQMSGSTLADSVGGTLGDDSIALLGGNDSAFGDDGADSIDGSTGDDLLFGGTGNDTLLGGTGANYLNGGADDDLLTLTIDGFSDTVYGGGGFDSLVLSGSTAETITMDGPITGASSIRIGTTTVRLTLIEAVTITGGTAADSLFGGDNEDSLDGGAGSDTLIGLGGDDVLVSLNLQGPDTLDGGAGTDLARINRASSALAFQASLAGPSVLADGTSLISIERLDFTGGSAADTVAGGNAGDTLIGGGGDDSLSGGGGDDRLETGFGTSADTLLGGAGNDTVASFATGAQQLEGGSGTEDLLILSRFAETAPILLDLGAGGTQAIPGGTTIRGFERGQVTAGSGADSLTGALLSDTLSGGGGGDTLDGGAGVDSLSGDLGNDSLAGGAGADSLRGGAGDDTLAGGADADRFYFDTVSGAGIDLVTDFEAADLIRIARTGFGGGLVAGQAPPLVIGADPLPAPGSTAGVFLYDTDTGLLAFDADGAGAGAAVAFATLQAGGVAAALTGAQFLIE